MGTIPWVTKSIMKEECKPLYSMCACGNASENMYNFLYTYNWLLCILSIKLYPPPSSHYLRSLNCSAAKFPLAVYSIAWQEWSFLHYLKASPLRHRWFLLKVHKVVLEASSPSLSDLVPSWLPMASSPHTHNFSAGEERRFSASPAVNPGFVPLLCQFYLY